MFLNILTEAVKLHYFVFGKVILNFSWPIEIYIVRSAIKKSIYRKLYAVAVHGAWYNAYLMHGGKTESVVPQ